MGSDRFVGHHNPQRERGTRSLVSPAALGGLLVIGVHDLTAMAGDASAAGVLLASPYYLQ
ncbi:MAG: hypothetical protein ACO1RT_19730 [Planctomycetaceae bacterium]